MPQILKGDMVEVITGNDRGKRGHVLRIDPGQAKAVVQGVNVRWKHMRKSQQAPQGGRMQREMPIRLANLMFYDEGAAIRSRLGAKTVDGKKVRILRKTGAEAGATVPEKAKDAQKKTTKKKKPAAPKKTVKAVKKAAKEES